MKNTKRFAALLVCLLLVVSVFAGCSKAPSTVGEYLEVPEVQEQLDEMLTSLDGSGVSMKIYAEGNTLVYECTFDEQLDLSDETAKATIVEALKSGCESQSSTFEGVLNDLKTEIKADDVKVHIVYNNADGSEIYSCDFE